MSSGLRKLVLSVHLTVSVGWIGAVAAYLALDVTTTVSEDPSTLRASYVSMELVARGVIVPLAIASLITGLIVSLGTKWGLFRHYWVVISLLLTAIATAVLLIELGTIGELGSAAADPGMSPQELRELASTLPHSLGGTAVLIAILVLNVYKPRGLTRYGRHKLRSVEGDPRRGQASA